MIRAKNYETVFKFVKVMPRAYKTSGFFFSDTVYSVYTGVQKAV